MNTRTQHTETSKFLSYVLRHAPESIGLTLDREGWADIDALVTGAARENRPLDLNLIRAVVAGSDKKRFELSADGNRIRAVQGHSTAQVDRSFTPQPPPAVLYHGTATRFLEAIRREGLKPGQRQYVHLSAAVDTAIRVGERHGHPVVLVIDAQAMHAAGHSFFQAENGVWLTAHVPAGFIRPNPT